MDINPTKSYCANKAAAVLEFEKTFIETVLTNSGGNISGASRASQMDRKHLQELVKKHGINPSKFRTDNG